MPQYGKLKIDQFLYNDSGTDVTLNLADLVTTGANTFTGNQCLGDNNQIRLGSSDDLKIYHDGSNSYLWDTGTGDLHILASDDLKLRSDDIHLMSYSGDETFARFIDDGAVELYYDNSKKFETTSTGVTINGAALVGGNLELNSDAYLKIGASNDLQLYHAGGNSSILNSTGVLTLKNTGSGKLQLMTQDAQDVEIKTNNELSIKSVANGAVELYYDGVKKLQTHTHGVHFNAAHTFMDDNYRARYGNSDDLQIYHDGNHSRISDTGTGKLQLGGSEIEILNPAFSEPIAKFIPDGAVELYYDNSKKFETTSFGAQFRGTTNHLNWIQNTNDDKLRFNDGVKAVYGNSDDLQIYHDATNSWLKSNTGVLFINTDSFRINNQANDESLIRGFANGAVELYYDNAKKFETTSTGVNITGAITVNGSALSGGSSYAGLLKYF